MLVGDDTVDGHSGRQVYGKASAPRPGSLQPQLHRLTLWPSLGRPGHLPEIRHDPIKSPFKAAFKRDVKEGKAKLEQYAAWLDRGWPSAAGSPCRRLGTTNIIDNGHSALRDRVRRVKNWRSGSMV